MFPFADNNPSGRTPIVTWAIIAINAVMFLSMTRISEERQIAIAVRYGFVPARISQLSDPRVIDVPVGAPLKERIGVFEVPVAQPVIELKPAKGEIYRSLITAMFLHGGWMHLLGNMWFLYLFGDNVEDRLGHVPFLLFYLFGGVVATLAHWAMDPTSMVPVIGASGAIAAVLGAYAVTFPHARVHTLVFLFIFITVVDLPALAVLGLWFLGQLLQAYGQVRMNLSGGVAWWAHVGGFVAGAALMPVLAALIPHRTRETPIEAQLLD